MSISSSTQDANVRSIVNSYRSIEILHPIVTSLYESPELKQMFWDTLKHDLHVIHQRSQNLADSEITVIQKAFKHLMDNEEDEIPAVELYVEEILGLRFVSDTEKLQTVASAVEAKDSILSQSHDSRFPLSSTATSYDAHSRQSHKTHDRETLGKPQAFKLQQSSNESLFVSDSSDGSQNSDLHHVMAEKGVKAFVPDGSGDPALKSDGDDEKLKRLFIMYHNAKNDFQATAPRSLGRTKSAKFLRDTIENCLAYIAAKQLPVGSKRLAYHGGMMDELQATLKQAVAAAEEGSGGKKRRFDEGWENVPQEPAKMRSQLVVQSLFKPDTVLTSEKKLGPYPVSRRCEHRIVPSIDHRQHRIVKPERAERRRPASPHRLYPASAGQSVSRVFEKPGKLHGKGNPCYSSGYGDRYRPSYH